MTAENAQAHLDRARAKIRQALGQWQAADLAKVNHSCKLLADAVSEMRRFEGAVRAGEVPATEAIHAAILEARQEIRQATHVVDACLAFHRGLTMRTGDAPPVYDAEGHLTGEASGLESEMHA